MCSYKASYIPETTKQNKWKDGIVPLAKGKEKPIQAFSTASSCLDWNYFNQMNENQGVVLQVIWQINSNHKWSVHKTCEKHVLS